MTDEELDKLLGHSHCKVHGLVRGVCKKCITTKLYISPKVRDSLNGIYNKITIVDELIKEEEIK